MQTSNLRCITCKHFWTNNKDELLGGCRAFPNGIPDEAIEGNAHDKVLHGQVGEFIYERASIQEIPMAIRQMIDINSIS